MAKELNFQDGNDVIKYQDTTSQLNLYISENGQPFDLTRLDSAVLKFGNENGYLMEKPIDFSNDNNLQSGLVTVYLDGDIMTKLIPGDYNIEIWGRLNPVNYTSEANDVTISIPDGLDDKKIIFPSEGELTITVDENIKASDDEVINVYAIDDIYEDLDNWKTQTVDVMSTNLSNQLLDNVKHWQGDISEDLKNELLKDIANDEGSIQDQLNKVLTDNLDNLINKEVSDAKDNIHNDLHNQVSDDISQQVSDLKTQIIDKFNSENSSLRNELENTVKSSIQDEINNTLQEMQKNGDIYATKEEFDSFKNDVNEKIKEINVPNILSQANTYTDNKINEITQSTLDGSLDVFPDDDLNNVTKSGLYFSTKKGIKNVPSQMQQDAWFKLEVRNNAYMVFQTLVDWNNNTFKRIESGDPKRWLGWEKISSEGDWQSAISNVTNTLNNKADKSTVNDLNNRALQFTGISIKDGKSVLDVANMKDGIYYIDQTASDSPCDFAYLEKVDLWGNVLLRATNMFDDTIYLNTKNSFNSGFNGWKMVAGTESDLQTSTDLNNTLYDCFFTDATANIPNFGRSENGIAIYKSNNTNGVQYAFATGDPNYSNGFAWRVNVGGHWSNWHIISSTSSASGYHNKYPNNLDTFLSYNDGYYTVYYGDSSGMPYAANGLLRKVSNNGGDTFLYFHDVDQNRYFVTTHNWQGWKGWREL